MIIPVHVLSDTAIYFLSGKLGLVQTTPMDLVLILSAGLIDLDHLAAHQVYHPRRNPFKVHPIHRNWKIVLVVALVLLFFRPVLFLGIGILSHFFWDWVYIKRYKL